MLSDIVIKIASHEDLKKLVVALEKQYLELSSRMERLEIIEKAAIEVVACDWCDNDEDAVDIISHLRHVIEHRYG